MHLTNLNSLLDIDALLNFFHAPSGWVNNQINFITVLNKNKLNSPTDKVCDCLVHLYFKYNFYGIRETLCNKSQVKILSKYNTYLLFVVYNIFYAVNGRL